MARSAIQSNTLNLSLLFAGIASLLLLTFKYAFRPGRPDPGSVKLLEDLSRKDDEEGEDDDEDLKAAGGIASTTDGVRKDGGAAANVTSPTRGGLTSGVNPNTPLHSNKTSNVGDVAGDEVSDSSTSGLHVQIEEIDKRGKALFKAKKYMDAAEVFSEALDLIDSKVEDPGKYGNLNRQVVTLMNNRSAMYEKGAMPDLALHDCEGILDMDPTHAKARTRKLRILESLKRHSQALVEVCALQLKFMQDNRDKLRLGIPVTPPVPQSKIEELIGLILPGEIEKALDQVKEKYGDQDRPLPSCHTILQLLQSFAGYNAWMAQAARDGGLDALNSQLGIASTDVEKIELLLKRGRRYAFHRKFENCKDDFETAYSMLVAGGEELKDLLEGDTYARVLEWAGVCRHLRYDLDGALKCYEACSDTEPTNAEILVKRAGVKMDSGKLEEAITLFDTALGLDPTAVDALLHRANLRMLEQKPLEARKDLERCLELRPDHIFARLRLATIFMALENLEGAKRSLDKAQEVDPQSSEVHSYRGELLFAQGEFVEARAEFDRAIECDAGNPTPYVNAALAVMNTPSTGGGPPDIPDAIRLLEKAIDVDPQFHTAYVHLGQLKLSMATDLTTAREVIALYDKGLDYCRTADELKDIVSMRILTVAQVDAAGALKMDTLHMQ
mmetsp:Transcript_4609/g.7006  ORF Transcript_4609/g.7006 Transcript_4609/m.7006 type:complete len:670 (-) Transcript_4609:47-2056(-)|eukprot:CAMPEP_0197234334 /NCGR_PEP_ID=MMETSP1429-20130617/2095_1 /TAXON_ID=49237 /ORGANISM="Chaetoceros  sp., Strain UNC1202" /LENGTH=669 /DNA_ID=CAMNT_0042692711 /DNA_START=48 /DNA_END=2057 /DNA_ORIENTATION=-